MCDSDGILCERLEPSSHLGWSCLCKACAACTSSQFVLTNLILLVA